MSYTNEINTLRRILSNGDRPSGRAFIQRTLASGLPATALIAEVLWPAYEEIEAAHREHEITILEHKLAVRLLRTLVDHAASWIDFAPSIDRSVVAFCGPTDADELSAQMATDLIEAVGFDVRFAGAGVANDEILEVVQRAQPDCLLLFASAACDLPSIRTLIDTIRTIGACDSTQIVVGGGVFNRAEGLAEEIGADLWAEDPRELADIMFEEPARRADAEQRTVGKAIRPASPSRAKAA